MNTALKTYRGSFCKKLTISLSIVLSLSSCYTYRVATKALPGSETSGKTVHSFFWGIVQKPKRVTTPSCDSLGVNGMAEVTVRSNFGYSLITVVTLGIWSPNRLEWQCGKPCQKVGTL